MAAIHAARPKAIRELLLDDVDLGNRRLVIAGHARPLDEFTHRVILDWLDYRRSRWPNTANLHVIVSQQSALETGPVSKVWITNTLRGLTTTLETNPCVPDEEPSLSLNSRDTRPGTPEATAIPKVGIA